MIGSVVAELRQEWLAEPPMDPEDQQAAERLIIGEQAGYGMVRRAKAAVSRLSGVVGCGWAPAGFWCGLRMSGALRRYRHSWRLGAGRPWLEEAFTAEGLPVAMRLGEPDGDGRRILQCPAVEMRVADSYAVDCLAGLLAGGLRKRFDDGWWIVLPRTGEVVRLLDCWGLSIRSAAGGIRVSVFYGRLLRDYLPPAVAESLSEERLDRAGDCPVLPILYAGLLWDPKPPHYYWPSSAKVLPWCISSQTRIHRGWNREFIYRASEILGVAHVPLQLRALLERWQSDNRFHHRLFTSRS